MNYTTKEIERAIEEILGLGKTREPITRRPRGRQKKEDPKTWALDFHDPENNRTFALISMCIKDDFDQSIEELAVKVSFCKSRPYSECLRILKRLSFYGKLGYYDSELIFRAWSGREGKHGLEIMCG